MLNVLHLYAGNLYGGIERLLATYAEQQDRCPELRHSFALCFEGKLAEQIRASGTPLHMLPSVRLSRPWTTWRSRRALKKLLDRLPAFDVIVTHAAWPHAVFAPVIRTRKLPLVFVAHDAYVKVSSLEQLAARTKPDRVIANSAFTASTVHAIFPGVGCDVCNIPVAMPKVDRDVARPKVRAAIGTPADRAVIVCTARMEPWKGQTLLIDALSKVQNGNWEAWIGGGAQRPQEEAYLATLRVRVADSNLQDRVRFLGHRSDVPELLAAADIHCQPNLGPEPFGIAFIEALYSGLPVVTTRLGAPIELIDDTCGRLTPPNDPTELARVLTALLENPVLRQQLGAGGPVRAASLCDVGQQLNELHRLLQAIVTKLQASA